MNEGLTNLEYIALIDTLQFRRRQLFTDNIPDKMNHHVRDFVIKVLDAGGVIAGGFMRAQYLAGVDIAEAALDIDIFCSNPTDSFDKLYVLLATQPEAQIKTNNSTCVKFELLIGDFHYKVDLVRPRELESYSTFGTHQEILRTFDFSISKIALLWVSDGRLGVIRSEYFQQDLQDKILRFENIICPIMALDRICKYKAKGYKLPVVEKMKIFAAWMLLPVERQEQYLNLISAWENMPADEQAEVMEQMYVD